MPSSFPVPPPSQPGSMDVAIETSIQQSALHGNFLESIQSLAGQLWTGTTPQQTIPGLDRRDHLRVFGKAFQEFDLDDAQTGRVPSPTYTLLQTNLQAYPPSCAAPAFATRRTARWASAFGLAE